MTAVQRQARSQLAHLRPEDLDAMAVELDALRESVLDDRGERDAAYIRRLIRIHRLLEIGGRVALLTAGRSRTGWVLGTTSLSLAKILDNMEIGHNVLHGQWDWMRDPKIHSSTWDWDHVSPAYQWRRAHNELHHNFTNILGHDNDLGYGIMRVDEDMPWQPVHLVQPVLNFLTACIFEYGIALFDSGLREPREEGEPLSEQQLRDLRAVLVKIGRQATKDYVLHPALSGKGWRATLTANLVANLVRNLWSHSVIMCGHFPEGVETFELDRMPQEETRGEWYLRQMLGSANISGSRAMHVATGNLSHQIEHHLFPDLPSSRYQEVAPRVRAVMEKHGLTYHAAPLPRQVASAWHKVVRLSLPNDWLANTNRHNVRSQLKELWRLTRGGRPAAESAPGRLAA